MSPVADMQMNVTSPAKRRDGERLHVAIIMDGNGRWAKQRGLPRSLGHRAGVAALRRTVEGCLLYTSPSPRD